MDRANKKIISAAIDLKRLNEHRQFLSQPLNDQQKKQFVKKLLELPDHFNDSIDFLIKEDKLILFWKIPKINLEAEKFHRKALEFARKGDLESAIANWQEATSVDPYNPEYFFNLGVALFEKKKYIESIESLSRTLSICPIYHRANLILGTSYLKIRKFENAKKYFLRSLKFDPNNALAFLNLGTVYGILKEYDNGLKMFEKAIKLAPKEPRAYMGIAKIYLTLGKNQQANSYFKKVIEFDKKGTLANYDKRALFSSQKAPEEIDVGVKYDNPEEYYSQGYRFYLTGEFSKSVQMYKKYLSIKPEDDYVWCALGEAQIRHGDIKQAAESFKRAAKLSPQKGLYFKELAIAFYYLKEYEKVIVAVSKAKELGKTDSVTYCIWGKALYELGNVNEAIIMLDHSLKSNKNNLLAKYYLANALSKNNELDNAIGYLEEILRSKLDTPLKEKSEKLRNELIEKEKF